MGRASRISRTGLLVTCGALLAGTALQSGPGWWTAAAAGAGLIAVVVGIRTLWGSVVVVTPDELVVQPSWPLKRRIRWYRIEHVEVVPGLWTLVIELISGDRVELPCVERFEDLYQLVEQRRRALDQV